MSKGHIAELTLDELAHMSTSELVALLEAAHLSVVPRTPQQRLASYGRSTLQALSLKARRLCRRQGY